MDKIFEELLVEEAGINKEAVMYTKVLEDELKSDLEKGKLDFTKRRLPTMITLPSAYVYYELDGKNVFSGAIEKVDILVSDISGKMFTTEKGRKDFIDRHFNGSFEYDSSEKTVYGRIAVMNRDGRYEIVSDIDNFSHELVHAYQKSLNGLNPKRIFTRALELYRNRTEDTLMTNIYYGIYWFNSSEITARVNQFYYYLLTKKYNDLEEVTNDEKFKSYLKTCKSIVNSLNRIVDGDNNVKRGFDPVVGSIERRLNTEIKTVANIIRRGNNIFLTKLYKAICYYLNESKQIEEGLRPSDSYLKNINTVRKTMIESF